MKKFWTSVSIAASATVVPAMALFFSSCGEPGGDGGDGDDDHNSSDTGGTSGGTDSMGTTGGDTSSGGTTPPDDVTCNIDDVPDPETVSPSTGEGAAPIPEGGEIAAGLYLLESIVAYEGSSASATSGAFAFKADGTGASASQLGLSLVRQEFSWETNGTQLSISPTCPSEGGTVTVDFTATAETLLLFPGEHVVHTYVLQ